MMKFKWKRKICLSQWVIPSKGVRLLSSSSVHKYASPLNVGVREIVKGGTGEFLSLNPPPSCLSWKYHMVFGIFFKSEPQYFPDMTHAAVVSKTAPSDVFFLLRGFSYRLPKFRRDQREEYFLKKFFRLWSMRIWEHSNRDNHGFWLWWIMQHVNRMSISSPWCLRAPNHFQCSYLLGICRWELSSFSQSFHNNPPNLLPNGDR